MKHLTVIALGGSLIVPHLSDTDGIDVLFLQSFRKFLLQELKKGNKYIVVTGGGRTTRVYQKAAGQIVSMTSEDLDWVGIHSTRLNAHLLRTIFQKEAHPVVIDHDLLPAEVRKLKKSGKNLFIAGQYHNSSVGFITWLWLL